MLFPLFAGIHYWYPFVTERMFSIRTAKWSFWLLFVGFNIAFLPMHWTGVMGMPRRVWTYDLADGWGLLNMISTIGAFVFAAGFAVLAANVLWPRGRQAPRRPSCPRLAALQRALTRSWTSLGSLA